MMLEDLRDAEIDRHGPFLGDPVVARLDIQRDGGAVAERVGEERLQEGLVDVRAVVVAGHRPDVLGPSRVA
jgi:hypothetical protein